MIEAITYATAILAVSLAATALMAGWVVFCVDRISDNRLSLAAALSLPLLAMWVALLISLYLESAP